MGSKDLELLLRIFFLSVFLFVVLVIKPEPGPCAYWARVLPLSYTLHLGGVALQCRLLGLLRLGLRCVLSLELAGATQGEKNQIVQLTDTCHFSSWESQYLIIV